MLENFQEQAHFENFIMGSEVTEFVNQVRDQVRIRQKRMSCIAENCTEHSIIWGMFMATTLNAAIDAINGESTEFEWNIFSGFKVLSRISESLTLKQIFRCHMSQLVNNQEEISC